MSLTEINEIDVLRPSLIAGNFALRTLPTKKSQRICIPIGRGAEYLDYDVEEVCHVFPGNSFYALLRWTRKPDENEVPKYEKILIEGFWKPNQGVTMKTEVENKQNLPVGFAFNHIQQQFTRLPEASDDVIIKDSNTNAFYHMKCTKVSIFADLGDPLINLRLLNTHYRMDEILNYWCFENKLTDLKFRGTE